MYMMNILLYFIILPIAVEALTTILIDSSIFYKIREKITSKDMPFFSELIQCKYCFSFWVTIFIIYIGTFNIRFLYIFIMILVVHRLSNTYHFLFDIIREKKETIQIDKGRQDIGNTYRME